MKSISRRDFYFRKFINCKNPESRTKFHNTFKIYRNMIVSLSRRRKSSYYTNYFNSHCNNMKKIWIGVHSLISGKSKNANPTKVGDSVTSDPNQVADCFDNFFTTITYNIRSKIPPTKWHFSTFMKKQIQNLLFISSI